MKRLLIRYGGWVLVFGSLLWLYLPALIEHAKSSLDPLRFNDDARIVIWPFYRYSGQAGAFQNDYLGDYVMATHIPLGYRALFTTGSWLWDAESFSKLLPYLLLPIVVAAAGVTGHAFAKKTGAWLAMAFVLGTDVYLERMGGGLPRAFAHPAVAVGVAAMVYGRVRLTALMVLVGAAFYPSAGAVLGMALVSYLFLLPANSRGEAERWRFSRRVKFTAMVGAASVVLMIPLFIGQRPYAPPSTPKDWQQYPEAGPAGTSSRLDLPPFKSLPEDVDSVAKRALFGDGEPWVRSWRSAVDKDKVGALELFALLLFLAWFRLARDDVRARRLLAFAAGIAIGHTIARVASPYAYVPNRYVQYGLPPVLAALVAPMFIGLLSYVKTLRSHTLIRDTLAIAPAIVLMLLVGGRGSTNAGLSVHVPPDLAQIYAKIAELPEGVMIAGWPDDPMSNVPYVSRRKVYMTGELHQPHHLGFLDEIRRRLRPFFEGYLAKSEAPLVRLRDEFGVTHLLVDTNQLKGKPPGYMPPMGGWITEIARQSPGQPYQLSEMIPGPAVVLQVGHWALVDLSGLKSTESH